MRSVSAVLRTALTAELIGPRGPLPRFVFRKNIKIKDAKPRRNKGVKGDVDENNHFTSFGNWKIETGT